MLRTRRSNNSSFKIILLISLVAAIVYFFRDHFEKTEPKTIEHSTQLTKEEVVSIIKETINEDPSFIYSALQEYQQKQYQDRESKSKEAISSKRSEIENSKTSPFIGNPEGSIVITGFFDVNCGYCKKAFKVVMDLIAEDKDIKFIYKELPILGPNSVYASKAALAVHLIDPSKFVLFHTKLMETPGNPDDEKVNNIVQELGIDANTLSENVAKMEVQQELEEVRNLAEQIGVHGTPAFVIEGELLPGFIDQSQFKSKINEIKKRSHNG